MTNDYKEQLLNYVTGNITTGTPTTDEIIKEIIETNRNNWEDYLPAQWVDFHFEGLLKERNSEILILYGGYRAKNSTGIDNEVYGIILLLDDEFNPIQAYYEYDNGTKLRYIQNIKQDDDNSFYMVDDTIFAWKYDDTILNSTKRLVLLNNFAKKTNDEYKLILKTSYIFPSGYNVFKCENLIKNPNQAQYVMVGAKYNDAGNGYLGISQIEFNIPYGSPVEWKMVDIIACVTTTSQTTEGHYYTSFVKFNEDKYEVKVIGGYFHSTRSGGQITSSEMYVRYYYKDYNYNTYSYTNILNNPELNISAIKLENQAIFINENKCYFILDNINNTFVTTWDLKIELWEYDISTSTSTKIYEKSYGNGKPAQQEQIHLAVNQGNLYIEFIVKKSDTTADYYVQRYEDEWNPKLVGENKPFRWNQRSFYIENDYNLLKIFLYPANPRVATWYFPIIKEIFNPNQYNGQPYESVNSLIPLYSNLYSENSLVFSRNLYNTTTQNNTMIASVEIPNNYLNDKIITENDLIGTTNIQLIDDETNWEKNIYETVFLNFINTINVIDEDTNTPYVSSAIKVNNSINIGTQTSYENSACTKYRINYTDTTTQINNLEWLPINKYNKTTQITFYADKNITSIDLISEDETTVYLNIPVEVEIGNTYTIRQKVRTGNKPTPVQLQYNNENINYNNEPVMVYTEEV